MSLAAFSGDKENVRCPNLNRKSHHLKEHLSALRSILLTVLKIDSSNYSTTMISTQVNKQHRYQKNEAPDIRF